MKLSLPVLVGALAIYLIGSSVWYGYSSCCQGAAVGAGTTMVEESVVAPIAAGTGVATIEENAAIEATTAVAAVDDPEGATEDYLRANPITFYFDTNANQLELDETQREYLTNLTTYLNNNKEAIVLSIGHTDNEGAENSNKYVSRKRAQFVRNYLIGFGIDEEQIETVAAGSEYPIESNDTEEGRAKNRRVEISLK